MNPFPARSRLNSNARPASAIFRLAKVAALSTWSLLLVAPLLRSADEPVMLPALSVTESLMKVNVVTSYQRLRLGSPFALAMKVGEVKSPSFAYDAGLRKGMEIVAIDGTKISGLAPAAVDRLLAAPKRDMITLSVRGGSFKKTTEIQISLKPPTVEEASAAAK